MATYGFEIEFAAAGGRLAFVSPNAIVDGADVFEIREIVAGVLGNPLYSIKADNSRAIGGAPGFIATVEAASGVGQVDPNVNVLFDPLTAFLEHLMGLFGGNDTFDIQAGVNVPWNFSNAANTRNFRAVYVYGADLQIERAGNLQGVNNVDALPVFTQFTFGFGARPANLQDNQILERFYNYFVVVNNNAVRNAITPLFDTRLNALTGVADPYLPYSLAARALFSTKNAFPVNVNWLNIWRTIEFLRFYVALSIKDMNPVNLWMGNKAYMSIMSRMTMELVLSLNLSDNQLDQLVDYVLEAFTNNAAGQNIRQRLPFQPMAPNDFIGTPIRVNITNGYVAALANTRGIEYFIRKIFRLDARVSNLQQVIFNDHNIDIIGNAPARTMYNNIANYDYFSPVPFSEPEDPMGFYSRDPALNLVAPRFLFEVRYAQQTLPSVLYDNAFRNACVGRFHDAFVDWV